MACNTCADSCLCAVVPGNPWVTVTGVGSAENPYTIYVNICVAINAIPLGGRQIAQTDLIVVQQANGECARVAPLADGIFAMGSFGTAQWIQNGQTLNILGQGLTVTTAVATDSVVVDTPCEAVQDCVGPMLTGQGFVYNDAANVWSNGAGGGTVLMANGSGGASFQPIPAPVPTIGCGLRYGGSGLEAAVSSWGFACAVSNGAPIYCDAGSNLLRTVPEHTSQQYGRPTSSGSGIIVPSQAVSAYQAISVTNPSTCRSATWMSVTSFNGGSVANAPGFHQGRARNLGQVTFSGGGLSSAFTLSEWDPGSTAAASSFGFSTTSGVGDTGVVGAGGTYSHAVNSIVDNTAGIGFGATANVATCVILVTR